MTPKRSAAQRRWWHNQVVEFAAKVREAARLGLPLVPKEKLPAAQRDPKFLAAVQRILEMET